MRTRHLLFLFATGLLLTVAACNESNLTSDWRTPEISSVNPDSAWARTSTYSWKDENILLGLQNDSDRLVILLKTRDRSTQAMIMRAGLTIWIDPAGKKKKVFGIHYPIGRQGRPMKPMGERKDGQGPVGKPAEMRMQQFQMPDTMEIIRNNEHIEARIKNDFGTSISTSNDGGTITYMFSIPINVSGDSLYGINVSPGSTITVGFETGELNFDKGSKKVDHPGGDEGPGDGNGRRGGFGGGNNRWQGRPPNMGEGFPGFEPIDFWTKVTLATKAAKQE